LEDPGFFVKQAYDAEKNSLAGSGRLALLPHQKRILDHCLHINEDGKTRYTTVIYSCPKKSGKTTLEAAIGNWWGEEVPETEIYAVANDIEQVQFRVFQDMGYDVKNKGISNPLKSYIQWNNGTYCRALAQEYKSAAGSRHSLTLWDELWGYQSSQSRLMWAELTPVPTAPLSMRFIATYAGIMGKSELLEDLYNKVVVNGEAVEELKDIVDGNGKPVCWQKGRMFAYWDHEARMPWQTPEYYEEEMLTLRPSDFLRLHRNEWVTEFEQFIPIEWWKACETLEGPLTIFQDLKYSKWPITLGVDVGVKHDCSAVTGVYYDSERGKVGLAFHRIWTPTEGNPLDLETTVEQYILEMNSKFSISAVVYDPTNFHRSMVTLRDKARINMVEYPQSAARMELVGQAFYDAIKGKYLEVYPDEELTNHIRFTTAENKGRGFRLVKGEKMGKPIDGAIALAMSVHYAIETGGVDISKPIVIEVPFANASAWKPKPTGEDNLPWPFNRPNRR